MTISEYVKNRDYSKLSEIQKLSKCIDDITKELKEMKDKLDIMQTEIDVLKEGENI